MRKKFLKLALDLYSKFSKSMSSRPRSFIVSAMRHFFFAWRLGRTQYCCSQNSRTFSTLEIIIAAEAKNTSWSDTISHSDFKGCAKQTIISKIHKSSVNPCNQSQGEDSLFFENVIKSIYVNPTNSLWFLCVPYILRKLLLVPHHAIWLALSVARLGIPAFKESQ